MREPIVVRLEDTEIVKFGPDANYQLILGDDAGTTPVRTGIQTSQPGYVAPMHSHPYMEILHVLDGLAEAWIEGGEDRPVTLRKGDTIALQPDVRHSFRVVGDQELRTFGIHASPRRIVDYRDGGPTDVRGYRVWKD
jgi:mannose-6-phosphate isomerase-like protein (cupin superfamily)